MQEFADELPQAFNALAAEGKTDQAFSLYKGVIDEFVSAGSPDEAAVEVGTLNEAVVSDKAAHGGGGLEVSGVLQDDDETAVNKAFDNNLQGTAVKTVADKDADGQIANEVLKDPSKAEWRYGRSA